MRLQAFIACVLLVLLSVLSGCLGDKADKKEGLVAPIVEKLNPAWEKVRNALNNTPCQVSAISLTQTSANVKQLAAYRQTGTGSGVLFGEADVHKNRTLQAYYNQIGFQILDVNDPMAPKPVISYAPILAPGTNILQPQASQTTYDVKFNHDGSMVFVGLSDRILTFDVTGRYAGFNYLTGTFLHPPNYRGQAHMLASKVIGGSEYVFAVPSISGTGVLVTKVVGVGQYAKLELVTVYPTALPGPTTPYYSLAPHDMHITQETIDGTNRTLLYLANGFGGIVVLAVDDPKNPQTVATVGPGVGGPPQTIAPSYYHSIQMTTIEGKRIVVTTAEVGYNTLKVWDFTDLRKPTFLGQWVFDSTQPWRMQHNVQIVNGTLFVAHYTEGLFGFDLAGFVNNTRAGLKPSLHFQPIGQTWDVVVEDGILYLSDVSQGLLVVGYGCFRPGDRTLTSTG